MTERGTREIYKLDQQHMKQISTIMDLWCLSLSSIKKEVQEAKHKQSAKQMRKLQHYTWPLLKYYSDPLGKINHNLIER